MPRLASVIHCIVVVVSALAAAARVQAMQFDAVPLNSGVTLILGRGEIADGDVDRLLSATMSTRQPRKVLALNSPGGNVLSAERLAAAIRRFDISVLVGANSTCASACFLLFAAAPSKAYMPGAMIGVHSASLNDEENLATLGLTTAMARDAAGYGVPPAVLGKMVATAPGDIAWLDAAELAAMGAAAIEPSDKPAPSGPAPSPAIPSSPPATAGAAALAPSLALNPPLGERSLAFQQGAADRRVWEAWTGSLPEAARLGAEYWASRRSLPRPGRCDGSAPEFVQGCLDARRQLATPDARRKSDPEYRAGWNSL